MESDNLTLDGERFKDQPHGWIQWKGTDVCIDIHCGCGEALHADTDFLYSFICPHCGRHYQMGSHVAIYELSKADSDEWIANGLSLIHISEPTRQAEISYAVFCL